MDDSVAPQAFVHLHNHSEYSLLDGASRISDLVKKAQKLGHRAIALTDHGNMFGAIEFYSKCKDLGMQPILGAELYWSGTRETQDLSAEGHPLSRPMDAFHLVVLAKSRQGYHSLCRLLSSPYLDGSHLRTPLAIISQASLEQQAEDLICLSSCLRGEFGSLLELLASKCDDPIAQLTFPDSDLKPIVLALNRHVELMQTIFGPDSYYIELIDNNLPQQKILLPLLVAAAAHYKLPIVASADSHYLDKDDATSHAVLTAIKNDLTMTDIRRRTQDAEFHLLDNEEMLHKFQVWPEALANQGKIAEQCRIELKFGEYFLPRFLLHSGETEADALRRLASAGLEERLKHIQELNKRSFSAEEIAVYHNRLSYEVEIIISMGFPGYFLIVQDFINWAKNNDIPVGPGRGSGAGSLVAYALRITDLDPIKLNLIFERFLNPERISMPDFDVDFCQDRRDEVIRYVTNKYGSENVAQITTFGKMKAKAALRDVGRVLQISYGKVDKIAKLIPNEIDIKLADALAREPRILEESRKDENIQKMVDLALKIEGLSRHTSVHAAGVVIADGGMQNIVPVYKADGSDALITQYEMKNAEKVGLVKFDFLGLKTLTVIHNAQQLIRNTINKNFDINNIDLECREVYENISAAHSVGIFQLESSGMQNLLKKLKPNRFEDIIAVVALFRPGPLGSGMVDDFIERKHGRQKIQYLHPLLEIILKDTYGIILYQEQVQKIAADLANYTLGEADLLRRAMGKKKPEEMAKQKARFVSGAKANNVDEKLAEDLFELMAKFAAYGFNKSHSAAYGLVSYQTAYLKTFYPEQFMAAIMTCDLDNTDKLVRYIDETRRLRFTLLPPDVNRSLLHFDVPARKTIGFGLAAIKGIGAGSIEAMLKDRELHGKFLSLTDLAKRVDLQKMGKKTLELLILAGALDSFGKQRAELIELLSEMIKYSEAHHSAKSRGQRLLFEESEASGEDSGLSDWEQRSPHPDRVIQPMEWLIKEKKILGVFLSKHPCHLFPIDIKRFAQIRLKDIPQSLGKKGVHCVAYLSEISDRVTKTGKRMRYFSLEDETDRCEAVAFEGDLTGEPPEPNSLVIAQLSIQPSFDGMGVNIRVEELQPLEKARKQTIKKFTIQFKSTLQLGPSDHNRQLQTISKLHALLEKFPGSVPVSLELGFERAKLKFRSEHLKIDPVDSVCQALGNMNLDGIQVYY